MASIIPGYQYDIFISYRQKDNRSGQWVTHFVNALKEELETIFKKDVSVYFDENPHDGLHDAHHVNDSLKEKIKCLVFIPIVSRTYCDPDSFAWSSEFLPFLEFAHNDQYGIKVKLANGNVMSRVLPVRIHDIDPEDTQLFEETTGEVMRSIDFIFKDSGVNRPLIPDDKQNSNTYKISYINQINKTGNSVREIINALRYGDSAPSAVENRSINKRPEAVSNNSKKKILTKPVLWTVLFILLTITGWNLFSGNSNESNYQQKDKVFGTSIVVLPFKNQNKDIDFNYFSEGISTEIRTTLFKISKLNVKPESISRSIRDSGQTLEEIADGFGVEIMLDGSVLRIDDQVSINVELVDVTNQNVLWTESFVRPMKDILNIYSEIAQEIAEKLKIELTNEEEINLAEKNEIGDITAYDYYLQAKNSVSFNKKNKAAPLREALLLAEEATKLDPDLAEAYLLAAQICLYGLSDIGVDQKIWLDSAKMLANKALSINKNLALAHIINGQINYRERNYEELEENVEKAYRLAPGNPNVMQAKAYVASRNLDYATAATLRVRGVDASMEEDLEAYYNNLAFMYAYSGQNEKAQYFFDQRLKVNPGSSSALSSLGYFSMFFLKDYKKAKEHLQKAYQIDNESPLLVDNVAWVYVLEEDFDTAEKIYRHYKSMEEDFEDSLQHYPVRHRLGYVKWKQGEKEEAKKWFWEEIRLDSAQIISDNLNGVWTPRANYYDLAGSLAFLGYQEEALKLLDFSQREGFFDPVMWTIDPLLDTLRDDPEFKKIYNRGMDRANRYTQELRLALDRYEEEKNLQVELKR